MGEKPIGDAVRDQATADIHRPFVEAVMERARTRLRTAIKPGFADDLNREIRALHHQHSHAAGLRLLMIHFTIDDNTEGRLTMEEYGLWKPEPYP